MRRSAWPSYLDALESYLGAGIGTAIDRGGSAEVPPSLASRPVGAVPAQFADRARCGVLASDGSDRRVGSLTSS